jgi:endonuclease/exonuclease/phosphatase family metal-dependent hydrolase
MPDSVPPPHNGECLRVATLNLWGRFADWPARRMLLARMLPAYEIDIYLLQEVVGDEDGGDQLAELSELLGHDWTARVVAESRRHEAEHEGVAIVSRLPLAATAVWPLPPSHSPRHLLEATVEWRDKQLSLFTLHAAVTAEDGRDQQVSLLAGLGNDALLLGADLNAPPSLVEARLGARFADTLAWDTVPTWPVNADEFIQAWTDKLGTPPAGKPRPRRLRLSALPRANDRRLRNPHPQRRTTIRVRSPPRVGRPRHVAPPPPEGRDARPCLVAAALLAAGSDKQRDHHGEHEHRHKAIETHTCSTRQRGRRLRLRPAVPQRR